MSQQPTRIEPTPRTVPDTLAAAYQQAILFPLSRAVECGLAPGEIQEFAAEEAAFGRVVIDERGLTAGMRLHLTEPVRAVFGDWREARAAFDRLLIPHLKDIEAVDRLDAEIIDLQQKSDREIDQREDQLETNTAYVQIKQRYTLFTR